ncbi:twin-arginine translocation signal domain-containing protein [Comamonas sp. F1-6]|uniref:twin-arginine translocation signal domain-containing protein n=1 Tax=Comamonas sp. F1-6 TaxID=673550 RepID=UPI0031D73712
MTSSIDRRGLLQSALAAGAAGALGLPSAQASTESNHIDSKTVTQNQAWDKVFPKSDKVQHSKLQFKNRYGIRPL